MKPYISEITAVSTKGQVVLPKSIRESLALKAGSKLMVFSDGENILLKPIAQPSPEEFSALLDMAGQVTSEADPTDR